MFKNTACLILKVVIGMSIPSISFADEWVGQDKTLHFVVGMGVGVIGNAVDSPKTGCISGAVVGILKEVYDSYHPESHTVSFKDATVTMIGACSSAKLSGVYFGPGWIRYRMSF